MLRAMSDLDSQPASRPRTARRAGPATSTFDVGPRVRKGALRIPHEAASRLRGGHAWLFRDTVGDRPVSAGAGESIDLFDPDGGFVARGLYDPDGPIAVRVFTRDPEEQMDQGALDRRVRWAAKLRAALLPGTPTPVGLGAGASAIGKAEATLTAYRVFHGEGDFLPGLTVDRYGDFLVAHLYTAALEPHLPGILNSLEAFYQPTGIYVQRRFRPLAGEGPRDPAELTRGKVAPVEVEVREGSLRFAIDVTAPLSTGLFLDLRLGRQAVLQHAAGRRALNLFSYTGALSVYAAVGGAKEIVSIDLSARAHARARRNLTLNKLPETGHEFIGGDAMAVMARMAERGRRFDLIILDPPAFAQSRERSLSVQRDYSHLVKAALLLAEPGTLMVCVTNAARFSSDEFMNAIGDGAGWAGRGMRIVEQYGLPPDFPILAGFPEGQYLKVLVGAVI